MLAYPGIWTPWAQVLCLQCHGPQLRGRDRHVEGYAARNEPREAYSAWRCDECGRLTSLHSREYDDENGVSDRDRTWSEVDELAELRDRLRDAGIPAEMEQTGGMCCAVSVGKLHTVFSSDEGPGKFSAARYKTPEREYEGSVDAIAGDVTGDEMFEFLKREVVR